MRGADEERGAPALQAKVAWMARGMALGPALALAAAAPAAPQGQAPGAAGAAAEVEAVLTGPELFQERPRLIHTFDGEAAGDQFGWVARTMGDLDGDGVLDFATSAPAHAEAGAWSGRVYAYSGRSGKLLWRFDGAPGESAGNGLGRAGDLDGDGVPDVIVGGPGHAGIPGKAWVLSGRDGSVLRLLAAGEVGDRFGLKVGNVGDLDGDGKPDLLVGAPGSDTAGTNAGSVHVLSGADGASLLVLEGEEAGDNFGSAVAGARVEDEYLIAVGAMAAGPGDRGRVYLFRGESAAIDLVATIDALETGRNLGQFFVALPGDFDGDGFPDVFASDWGDGANGSGTGRVSVHSGRTGEPLLAIAGERQGENFGTSISDAGDVDHDGIPDLIVGAWQNAEHAPSAGRCALHSGKDGRLLAEYTCRQAGDTFGFDATGIGDVDGDGAIDFLLTSAWSPVHGPRTGRVFVVAGPSFPRPPGESPPADPPPGGSR